MSSGGNTAQQAHNILYLLNVELWSAQIVTCGTTELRKLNAKILEKLKFVIVSQWT